MSDAKEATAVDRAPAEASSTYTCSGCGERIFPVATSRGLVLGCGCVDDDGVFTTSGTDPHDFPEKWEWDEAELEEVLRDAE